MDSVDLDNSEEINSEDETTSVVFVKASAADFEPEVSDENDDEFSVGKKVSRERIKPIINKHVMDYMFVKTDKYDYKSWDKAFPDKKVLLRSLLTNEHWDDFMDTVDNTKETIIRGIEKRLGEFLLAGNMTIVPRAELVFSAFNTCSPEDIQVVIIGQDPYPGAQKIGTRMIPDATGLSFSGPVGLPVPLSCKNIFNNLIKYKHMTSYPKDGSLGLWAMQGVFMINAALTNFYTEKGAHTGLWQKFTEKLIAYLNTECKNIVFMVWGASAHKLCKILNEDNHCIITSSHPSPLSFMKEMTGGSYVTKKKQLGGANASKTYPPFESVDHFGKANAYLKSVNKTPIIWDLN
jgi:uracil-DNA glycosylase